VIVSSVCGKGAASPDMRSEDVHQPMADAVRCSSDRSVWSIGITLQTGVAPVMAGSI